MGLRRAAVYVQGALIEPSAGLTVHILGDGSFNVRQALTRNLERSKRIEGPLPFSGAIAARLQRPTVGALRHRIRSNGLHGHNGIGARVEGTMALHKIQNLLRLQ